jgi:Haemolysin-III related
LARYREAVISLAAAFGTSADFHRFAHSVTARRRMGRLDHSMFYVLLAGTFTPVCLLALPLSWAFAFTRCGMRSRSLAGQPLRDDLGDRHSLTPDA